MNLIKSGLLICRQENTIFLLANIDCRNRMEKREMVANGQKLTCVRVGKISPEYCKADIWEASLQRKQLQI